MKSQLKIKQLNEISLEAVFIAFNQAFKDYEVKWTKGQFMAMLKRRGFDPNCSFGLFEGAQLVSFTLNCTGRFNGIPTAYDSGTGTIPNYRGKRLPAMIFEHSLPFLRREGVDQYLLEVLQSNTNAISIYHGLGFEVKRELNYFSQRIDAIHRWPETRGSVRSPYSLERVSIDELEALEHFWDFAPSWQNGFDSIHRDLASFTLQAAKREGVIVGYCISEPTTGEITQLAVHKEHRRKGIGSMLLEQAIALCTADTVKLINTERDYDAMDAFLASKNIALKGRQFEMIKPL